MCSPAVAVEEAVEEAAVEEAAVEEAAVEEEEEEAQGDSVPPLAATPAFPPSGVTAPERAPVFLPEAVPVPQREAAAALLL